MRLENPQAVGSGDTHLLRSASLGINRSQHMGLHSSNRLSAFRMHACKSSKLNLHDNFDSKSQKGPTTSEFKARPILALIPH